MAKETYNAWIFSYFNDEKIFYSKKYQIIDDHL